MRGVVLAGGLGTRCGLFARRCGNKHVIPVYNRPMIEYPLSMLSQAGIKEVAIVTSNHHAGDLAKLIGDGREYGFNHVTYLIQVGEGGISHALRLAEDFTQGRKFAVVLGDNFFEMDISNAVDQFKREAKKEGACVFLKEVNDPQRFGIAEMKGDKIVSIEEKPKKPKSNFAVTGLYFLNYEAFEYINLIKPSKRGELEITDVLNYYIEANRLSYEVVNNFWSDCGVFDSLLRTANWLKENDSKLIASGRFSNYQFRLKDGSLGDYIIDMK